MNEKNIILVTRTMDGKSESYKLGTSNPLKLESKPGTLYLLKNTNDNFAPENVTLKRVGKDLQLMVEGTDTPSLVFEDYFAREMGDEPPPVLLGMPEDGQLYHYVPLSGESYDKGYLMAEGQLSALALGGNAMGTGEAFFASEQNDAALWPVFLGLFALAGAVGTGMTITHNRSGKNHDPKPVIDMTPPKSQGVGGVLDNTGSKTGPLSPREITDETRPQITGEGKPGNTITIYDNDKVIGSTTVDDYGNWSWTPDAPLADGDHAIMTTEKNKDSGVESKPSPGFDIVVDTTPPKTSTTPPVANDNVGPKTGPIENGDVTDDTTPELSGKGEPGNTIDIWDNDEKIGSVDVDKDGNWSWTPDAPLADGNHNITTTESDPAGNTSEPSPGITIVVDTTPPQGSITPPVANDNVGPKTGPIENGDVTDDTTPELSGKGEPGNTIDIWDNDEKIGSVDVDKDGNWCWTPDAPLADGNHNITTTESDPAGNTSGPSPGITIVVDTTPPAVGEAPSATDKNGKNVNDGVETNDSTPEISGKGEPGSTIDIWDNGEKVGSTDVDENGSWRWTPETPMTDGEHTLSTTETDKAGNTSEPSPERNIIVDTVAPNAPSVPGATDNVGDVTGPLTNGSATDDTQPEFSGVGEPGNTIDVWDNGEKIGSINVDEDGRWSWKPDVPLAEGDHAISTTETDKAGNTSEPSPGLNIVVDTTPPDASALSITGFEDNVGEVQGNIVNGGNTDDNTPVISGTGTAGDTITLYTTVNGNKVLLGKTTVEADGTWKLALDANNALKAGVNQLTAVETDPVGNSTTPTPPYVVTVHGDGSGPAAPGINAIYDDAGSITGQLQKDSVTDDTTPTLQGTGEAGNTIRIYDNGTLIGSTTVNGDGSWIFTPSASLKDGNHVFTADAVNGVGQVSEKSGEWSISVDTARPDAVTDLVITDNVGDVQGVINNGDTTDDTTPTFSGTAEPGSTVNVYDGNEKVGSVDVGDDGKWSFTPGTAMGDGDHSLSVSVTDPAGNESVRTPSLNITVDTSLEPIQITSVMDDVGAVTGTILANGVTDDTQPTLNGMGKAGSVVTIYDGSNKLGTVTVGANGKWSFTPSAALSDGSHTLHVKSVDPAGTPSEDSFTFTVDTQQPNAPTIDGVTDDVGTIQGNIASGGTTDDPTPTLNGKAEAGKVHRERWFRSLSSAASVQFTGWRSERALPINSAFKFLS